VHVTSPYVGGGFGGKTLWRHQVLAAAAVEAGGRPVRIMLTREGVYRVVGGRTLTEQRVAIGAQADGRFDALIHTGMVTDDRAQQHARAVHPAGALGLCGRQLQARRRGGDARHAGQHLHARARRGGRHLRAGSAIDELAHAMQMDPIELRIRNEPEKDPTTGTPFSSRHIVEAYRAGAERFGWEPAQRHAGQRGAKGEWLVGMGCATATYPVLPHAGRRGAHHADKDGRAKVEVAAHEMGMGTATAQTQVTAERLGLPMDKVTFCHGDSRFPGVVLAGGSQQTASIGSAVMAAQHACSKRAAEALRQGLAPARPEAGRRGGRDGGLGKIDEPARFEAMRPPGARRPRRTGRSRPARRRRSKCSTGRCIRTARCSAKCG
jgi:xanthine dehydrogenase YagR molybdenum-binding subunit